MLQRDAILAGIGAVLLTGVAHAADTPASWKHKPSASELLGVWPRAALAEGRGGKAVITCKVSVQGGLYECVVASETPPGSGFGAAAVALSPQLLMNPPTHDGRPVGGSEVNIPINFESSGVPTGSHLPGGPLSGPPLTHAVYSNIPWLEAPTLSDMIAAYPPKAREAKAGGHVALDCHFDDVARLHDCQVLSEQPGGMGFAKAARALAPKFLGPRTDAQGTPLKGATTQVAVTFAPEMLTGVAPTVGQPHWARLPEAAAMRYPPEAIAAHVMSARVVLTCTVGAAGRLEGCAIFSEDHPGLGFDKAALSLSSDFQVSVWSAEGLPVVGGAIHVPIRYVGPTDTPAEGAAAQPAGATPSRP